MGASVPSIECLLQLCGKTRIQAGPLPWINRLLYYSFTDVLLQIEPEVSLQDFNVLLLSLQYSVLGDFFKKILANSFFKALMSLSPSIYTRAHLHAYTRRILSLFSLSLKRAA